MIIKKKTEITYINKAQNFTKPVPEGIHVVLL